MANTIRTYLREHTNPPVFIVSAVLAIAFVLWGVLDPSGLSEDAKAIMTFITTYFGWWFVALVTGLVVFTVYLFFSEFGHVRIGGDGERPEWGRWSWFSMLFTAGMGIGLVFFGVAEPIFHFNGPPIGEGGTAQAARDAMSLTFFHWGLHPWAVYIIVGLSLGYFCFRHNMPLRPAAAFYPLIGHRVHGWIGHLIDILAVFGTLFGLATSLGLGAIQINAGLGETFGVAQGATAQVIIIAVVTAVAVTSVMLGLSAGVRRLSVINMILAGILALFVFILGPTLFILEFFVQSTGAYIQQLPELSFRILPFSEDGGEWLSTWTLFYWAWWISWSPFVGMFLARISRGRTVREFVLGTLLAPVGVSAAWFTIFGGSALQKMLQEGNEALAGAGTNDAMFVLLQNLAMPGWLLTALSLLAITVVTVFFATSSDSGSLVVDMLTNGGDPNPRWQQRLFWAVLEGTIAAILLVAGAAVAGNPLESLQTAAVAVGLPFSFVLFGMAWGLLRQLRSEPEESKAKPGTTYVSIQQTNVYQ